MKTKTRVTHPVQPVPASAAPVQPVPAMPPAPKTRRRGFYTRRLKTVRLDGISNVNPHSIQEETDLLRLFTRQAAGLDVSSMNMDDLFKFYQTISLMLSRISTMSRAEKTISSSGDEFGRVRDSILEMTSRVIAARKERE